jgi:acyl-CoA thioesterase-1
MPGKILLCLAPLLVACDTPAKGGATSTPGAAAEGDHPAPGPAHREVVLVLGTSLSAGLGLDPEQAYAAHLQTWIDSLGFPYRVVNAGVSGQTSAGGLTNIDWLLRERVAVILLELGANDGLRGLEPEAMRENLEEIIRRTRARYPDADVLVAGMEAPPNLGDRYTDAFRAVFPEVARAHRGYLIPFLLDGVAGFPEWNQADGIHPTAEGQRMVAENAWRVLEGVLRRRAAGDDTP